METPLTPKEIGQRLAALRKAKGLSQEDLAKLIGISRPSLAQMEQGNRGMDVLELVKICETLQCTMYALLGQGTEEIPILAPLPASAAMPSIRLTAFHWEKFQQVLLYILEHCAGKPNVGETVLNKLLYFSDFNYYELYEESMTGATYRKLPYGPVPQNMDTILQHMIDDRLVQRIKVDYHGYPQTRYLPLQKADLQQLKASEKEVIDRVIEHMGDWSATTISEWSHKDMPWQATQEGEDIDYELVFYREVPFSVRNYEGEEEA